LSIISFFSIKTNFLFFRILERNLLPLEDITRVCVCVWSEWVKERRDFIMGYIIFIHSHKKYQIMNDYCEKAFNEIREKSLCFTPKMCNISTWYISVFMLYFKVKCVNIWNFPLCVWFYFGLYGIVVFVREKSLFRSRT
jgi:hypothetical protein